MTNPTSLMQIKISYLMNTSFHRLVAKRTAEGRTMPEGMYDIIWRGQVSTSELDGDDVDPVHSMLEYLFREFNIGERMECRCRSMSVHDVVEVNGVSFLCGPAGWKKVDNTVKELFDAAVTTGLV